MIGISIALAAALASPPLYPGARVATVGGMVVQTIPDQPEAVKARYVALLRKAGWRPSIDEAVLNGVLPGMTVQQQVAVRQAGTLLSFERDGRTADILISAGTDRLTRGVTTLLVVAGKVPGGGTRGRPSR